MNDTLEITTLGGLEIRLGGQPVTGLYSRKAEALLVYLACTGRSHPRDVLADLLWDEVTQSRALGNLRVVLHSLREQLGPFVEITRTTVGLKEQGGICLDVAMFQQGLDAAVGGNEPFDHTTAEQVANAVELYKGDFLAGFYVRDCPRFEDWQLVEQERLRGLVVGGLNRLATYYGERGECDLAVAHARRLLELDPLLEQAHRQVMECLACGGQRSAALGQYETARQVLQEELGVEPEPETTALYEAILVGEVAPEAQAEPPPHNLPPQVTPFVGREKELFDLSRVLLEPHVRLLNIIGPGGMGKTRLAQECAATQLDHNKDGVFFVSLAPLNASEEILSAIADAAGCSFYEGSEPKQQVLEFLGDRHMLLVLDNFEHLLEGADLVSDIVRAAPQVKVLVTSRVALNLQEEQLYPLAGMDYPEEATREDTAAYSAVALFVESARRARPDFEAKGDELDALVRICQLLGGMPLAIILAAGWVDALTPAQIESEIRGSLDFLETEMRNVPERQRSVRAAFDHSWKLLSEREREIVQALSVFRGGFTRDAAQAVIGASLRELRSLVNKSLIQHVVQTETPGENLASGGRYDLHELLRQYAEDKLDQTPDGGAAARDRHCAYFCAALEHWDEEMKGPRSGVALQETRADDDNIRTAWDWAVGESLLSRLGQAADGLGSHYVGHRRFQDGKLAFGAAAAALLVAEKAPPTQLTVKVARSELLRVYSRVLAWHAAFHAFQGDRQMARKITGISLGVLDDPALLGKDVRRERAWVLNVAAYFPRSAEDLERSESLWQQSLSLYRDLGDDSIAALVLRYLGMVAEAKGDYPQARQRTEESLALRRRIDDATGVSSAQISLGCVLMMQGQLGEGEVLVEQGLEYLRSSQRGAYRQSGLQSSAMVSYYCGSFGIASALLVEPLARLDESAMRTSTYAFVALISLGLSELHRGKYEAASAYGEESLARARESDNVLMAGGSYMIFGAVTLARGAYAAARRSLVQAEREIRYPSAPPIAWPGYLQVLATLAYAERYTGDGAQAWTHLTEVLRRGTEVRDYLGVLTAVPAVALLMVDAGQSERAVELYALASSHGYVANSVWFDDVVGKEIAAVAETLPPDTVAAAQERGRTRDLWETAEELLKELESAD